MKKILVTGSSGLVGSETVKQFCEAGYEVHGVDSNERATFFGNESDNSKIRKHLSKKYNYYFHHTVDIRDREKIENIFKKNSFELIVHAAAQPSHDWSGKYPIIDFDINANSTIFLLEMTRTYCPGAVFIFTSSNKVYGDLVNQLPFVENDLRYDLPQSHSQFYGISEKLSIDNSTHSPFGVAKTAADLMTQEYGLYFGLKTVVFRFGCITGPLNTGTKLHGFLSYLVKCILEGKKYAINGYKGKQVRDNIHAYDVVQAFQQVLKKPGSGKVYNLGGGRSNSLSILEAIKLIEKISGKTSHVVINVEPRLGDHIWYISDNSKFTKDYPKWDIKNNIKKIITEMCDLNSQRL